MLKSIKSWWNKPATRVDDLCELVEACGALKAQERLAAHFEKDPKRRMSGTEVADEIRGIAIRKPPRNLTADAGI